MALVRSHYHYMPLGLLAMGTALIVCAYQSAGAVPSRGAEIIIGMSWMLFLLVWMESDARRRGGPPCYDFGFLSALVFPFSLVWYCIWSRGWKRGVLILLGLTGLWLAPWLAAVVYWALLQQP